VFGDHRPVPEFIWTVSADSPSDAMFLNDTVSAPRCQGSDEWRGSGAPGGAE
jgi:hypothetical protein